MPSHDIVVKAMLTPEEFVAARAIAESDGVSMSALIRQLLRKRIRDEVSGERPMPESPETGQEAAK